MGITKVVFYSSATDAEKVILKECTGPEAEEMADLFLHNLIFTAKQQPSHQIEMVVTLKDGSSWETGFDLEYTYLTDTVRSLIIRSAHMETCYGDEPHEAQEFLDAIKATREEIVKTVVVKTQWENEFFLSEHRVDLFKKKRKMIEIYIEAYIDLENGDLVIHGHDLGPTVEEHFGKSDYEYWRTVPCLEKEKVLPLLKAMTPPDRLKRLITMYKHPDIVLVRLVKEHFSKDTAVSSFEEWCNQQGIKCEGYSV